VVRMYGVGSTESNQNDEYHPPYPLVRAADESHLKSPLARGPTIRGEDVWVGMESNQNSECLAPPP
jgi:hypothetical protein